MVSYKDIRNRIKTIWPGCKNIWMSDLEYEFPTREEVETVIALDHTERLSMRGYKFDCDDFALQLSAAVSRWVGANWTGQPWAFGQIMGRKFKHVREIHTCNICVLENEIILIEPQTDKIWVADSFLDDPFFVKVP